MEKRKRGEWRKRGTREWGRSDGEIEGEAREEWRNGRERMGEK